MRLIPNEYRDFAYSVPLFRVGRGGMIRMRLRNGEILSRRVSAGEYIADSVRRIYQVGTSAGDFRTDPFAAKSPHRSTPVPYATDDDPLQLLLDQGGGPVLTDDGLIILL